MRRFGATVIVVVIFLGAAALVMARPSSPAPAPATPETQGGQACRDVVAGALDNYRSGKWQPMNPYGDGTPPDYTGYAPLVYEATRWIIGGSAPPGAIWRLSGDDYYLRVALKLTAQTHAPNDGAGVWETRPAVDEWAAGCRAAVDELRSTWSPRTSPRG